MVFLGLKHTILLNILLINYMVCRYNKLCPCVRNTRDYGLVHDDLFRPEKQKLEKNTYYDCEQAERASRNFCTFASETCDSSQSVNNILLVKTRYNMS